MSNVVSFRTAQYSHVSASLRSLEIADDGFPEPVSRMASLHSKAKTEIHDAIFMLDLATQQARQLAKIMRDPTLQKDFSAYLSTIEDLLQIVRDKARDL